MSISEKSQSIIIILGVSNLYDIQLKKKTLLKIVKIYHFTFLLPVCANMKSDLAHMTSRKCNNIVKYALCRTVQQLIIVKLLARFYHIKI